MLISQNFAHFVPSLVPVNMNGTIKHKIYIKKDFVKSDGTSSLYLDLYQNSNGEVTRKRLPLNISVPIKSFDAVKQRIKKGYKYASDFNLIIEKKLAEVNEVKINYRLNNQELTIEKLLEDLTQPSLRINFNTFYYELLEYQFNKGIIKHSTYKQQKSTLNKIKLFKKVLLFRDINENLLLEFRGFLKQKLNNKPATVEIAIKNFKKYLHEANERGIKTALTYNKIKVKRVKGEITFLLPEEVKRLYDYYQSDSIFPTWKNILQRYLFSCFTGLRISDIEQIGPDNFINDVLVFTAQKTTKLQQVKLNKTALSLVEFPQIFNGTYEQQTINKELKQIAKACNINKRLYYHSSRHTFATNYLIAGGQLQNLQKLLGHSKIETTMVYTHVVDNLMHKEIGLLDGIVS